MARAPKVVAFALIAAGSLDKEMKSIVTAVGKLDERIQLYLISELAHINEHKNPTRLNSFFEAMAGKGTRVTAMSAYVQKFGTVKFDETKGEKGKFVIDNGKVWDLEAAKLVKWYSLKPEQALRSFDLEAEVKKILQAAVDRAADESRNEAGDKIDMSLVQKLIDATGFKVEPKAPTKKAKANTTDTQKVGA